MVDSFSSSQPTQISNGRMINSGRNRFIKTILHPASPKCLQTKNPTNVGLKCLRINSIYFFLNFLLIGNASTKPTKAPYTVVFSDEDAIEHTVSQPNTDA